MSTLFWRRRYSQRALRNCLCLQRSPSQDLCARITHFWNKRSFPWRGNSKSAQGVPSRRLHVKVGPGPFHTWEFDLIYMQLYHNTKFIKRGFKNNLFIRSFHVKVLDFATFTVRAWKNVNLFARLQENGWPGAFRSSGEKMLENIIRINFRTEAFNNGFLCLKVS